MADDDNAVCDSMTRRRFLKSAGQRAVAIGVLGALGPGALEAATTTQAARKPNLVYVFPDQHRQCSWSMTDPQVKTPNLQALAGQSMTFSRCMSTYPLCSPHRATLLTGRFPQSHTVTKNGLTLPTTEITLGDVFKQAGYATGYVGKWHLHGDPEQLVPPGPHRHGFDWWRVCTNYRDRYQTRYFDDAGKSITLPDYAPKCQMDLTLDFIQKHAHEPFCIFLSWHPPHPPYEQAPQKFVDLYPQPRIQLRSNVPGTTRRPRIRHIHNEYFAHVSAEDAEMGRLMQKLDELGIADNTILVYSSDHGDMLGSRGRFGKNVPWEESVNVPLIVRYPGVIPAGRVSDTLISSVDLAPTLLGLAGIAAPAQMQGLDLSAALRGEKHQSPESVFITSDSGALGADSDISDERETAGRANDNTSHQNERPNQRAWRGVRTATHTYAQQGGKGARKPALLYDNIADPMQQTNLINKPGVAQLQPHLQAMLTDWLKRVGDV